MPSPIRSALSWAYRIPPSLAGRADGNLRQALTDVLTPKTHQDLVKGGDQLASFGFLRDDGGTACGNWIYCGVLVASRATLTMRRDSSDPSGLGQTLNWGFAWPVNRRIIYNRASCDPRQAVGSKRTVHQVAGRQMGRQRRARHAPDAKPEEGHALHHEPGRRGRLFAAI